MCCSPLLESILQVGCHKACLKLRSVFGVVYSCWEHFREVSGESAEVVWEVSVEALVQEDQIDQAVVQNERLSRSDEFQEKGPNALALGLIALKEEGLVDKP